MILGLGLKYRKHPNSPPMFWSPLVAGWELVASSMFWRATCQEGQSLCDMLCQQVFATWTRNQAVDNTGQIKTTIVEGLLLLPVFPFVKYEAVWSMFAPCCLFHPSGLAKFNLIFVKLRLGTPICKIQTDFFRRNKCSNHLGSELDVIKRLDVAIWLLGLAKRNVVSMCCHVKTTHVQGMWRQVSKSQMLSPTFPSKPFTPPWRVDAIAVFFLDNLFDLSRMVHGNCILHISIGPHHVLSFGWCQIKFVCPTQRMGHAPRHFFQFFRSGSASHTKTFDFFFFCETLWLHVHKLCVCVSA